MSKAKINYALIISTDPQEFTNSVNEAMADGWLPIGGVSTLREPGNPAAGKKPEIHYSQAVLRRGVNGVDIVT